MQQQSEGYRNLADSLKSASALLNLEFRSSLNQDIITVCNHLVNPSFRIAVFGPFNHGKSTLLNAILGTRTLPIDLIPTTGAMITVKYGSDVRTRIILVDGTEVVRSGTEILQQFAILDGNRQMRKDVAAVEVFYPHPLLKTGVEFIDLPGTNDREAQDNLVKEKLLSVDLVVQLLDARKLMTLGERENLRDWLSDRGIKTVIFVANFLNLLEPEEQKQVQNRLLFVAESFRTDLPPGFSNLYRVDALPALRARLKGDVAAASSSGLVAFETALQNIVSILQQNSGGVRLPRVQAIASQIEVSLKAKIDPLLDEVTAINEKQNKEIVIKEKAANVISQGFTKTVKELSDWLQLPNLLKKYQTDGAIALAENKFNTWQTESIKKDLKELRLAVIKWLYDAYDFFKEQRPEDLLILFPNQPQIPLPPKPGKTDELSEPGSIAVGGGIGWLLGGPLGAAVAGSISYLLNKKIQEQDDQLAKESYHQQVAKLCIQAMEDYLSNFSNQGLSILAEYEQKADQVIRFTVTPEKPEVTQKRADLQKLQNSFNQLLRELEKSKIPLNYQPYAEIPKNQDTNRVYIPKRERVTSTPEKTQTQTRVESPKQQVSPPPKASPRPQEVDAKFRNWEVEEEIAQMKAEMRSPGSQNRQQQQTQNKQASNPPKTQAEKDKIARAYRILKLEPSASLAEVKQAYKTLVKKCHPDLFVNQPQLQKQALEKMRLINEAYDILADNYK
ncbi:MULTISPECIES: dynamin family protein [unclassified Nodularia (in: cyanobacteria)]|uniref:dynamin family protein n=1 Tax=unclassified Nodularia (in: cyanobacteria) TaxID=2656917 RepID=UPI0018822AF2|nr:MULTISPECIES: dynamin family protein [unclassified Nodularia (in: cyanobacteria)]MBE9201462.1 dynamin family protein [Nodularia sp. LEGE 06071]MCC2691454.1 dynamin family protein [Nodularia sp. LEGE 04288]